MNMNAGIGDISDDDIYAAIRVFSALEKDPKSLMNEKFLKLRKVAGHVCLSAYDDKYTKGKKEKQKQQKKIEKENKRNLDKAILRSRGLMQQRRDAAQQKGLKLLEYPTGNEMELSDQVNQVGIPIVALPPSIIQIQNITSQQTSTQKPIKCYICGQNYYQIHFFYSSLCPNCASLNWQKRLQVADLRGKIVICTGSRVKIGHQCCLRLLKCGAFVIATTRFPNDASLRFIRDPDFEHFKFRLHIYGLDFRDLNAVQRFTDFVNRKYPRLDIIINNAAQTVRRPPFYYQHLMENELKGIREMPLEAQWLRMNDPQYENEIQGNHNVDEQQQYSKLKQPPIRWECWRWEEEQKKQKDLYDNNQTSKVININNDDIKEEEKKHIQINKKFRPPTKSALLNMIKMMNEKQYEKEQELEKQRMNQTSSTLSSDINATVRTSTGLLINGDTHIQYKSSQPINIENDNIGENSGKDYEQNKNVYKYKGWEGGWVMNKEWKWIVPEFQLVGDSIVSYSSYSNQYQSEQKQNIYEYLSPKLKINMLNNQNQSTDISTSEEFKNEDKNIEKLNHSYQNQTNQLVSTPSQTSQLQLSTYSSPSSLPELQMPKKPLLLENLSSRNRTLFLQGISGTYGGSIQISEDGTSIIRIKGEKDMEQNITDNTNKKERSIKQNTFEEIQTDSNSNNEVDEYLITNQFKRTREERDNEEYLDENGISGSEYGEYEDVDDNNESNLADGNNQQIKIPKNKSLQRMGINEEIDQGRIFNVNIPMERRDQRIIPVLNLPDNYDEEDDEDYGEENEEDVDYVNFNNFLINKSKNVSNLKISELTEEEILQESDIDKNSQYNKIDNIIHIDEKDDNENAFERNDDNLNQQKISNQQCNDIKSNNFLGDQRFHKGILGVNIYQNLQSLQNNQSQFPQSYTQQEISSLIRSTSSTIADSALLSQVQLLASDVNNGMEEEFPLGAVDVDHQQIDLRKHNSWVASFDQINCVEVVEVNCVNSLSPQILISRFVGKMSLDPSCDHYIINVSAMEGKFDRQFKSGRHAHTNAAKSSLNMITRTLGAELSVQRIYINSVDTGWITDEKPFQATISAALQGFSTPIDEVDAMSRIIDPVFVGINTGINHFGKFFKDYKVSSW